MRFVVLNNQMIALLPCRMYNNYPCGYRIRVKKIQSDTDPFSPFRTQKTYFSFYFKTISLNFSIWHTLCFIRLPRQAGF
jgi:hypothetical protein